VYASGTLTLATLNIAGTIGRTGLTPKCDADGVSTDPVGICHHFPASVTNRTKETWRLDACSLRNQAAKLARLDNISFQTVFDGVASRTQRCECLTNPHVKFETCIALSDTCENCCVPYGYVRDGCEGMMGDGRLLWE
jgi:hypothetical protein